MLFRTHIAFSFLIGLIFISVLNPVNQILFMILVLSGSAVPDIDQPNSKIGKNFKIIGWLFRHRGIFHSVFMALLISSALYFFTGYFSAFLLGYLSHLVTDSFTVSGIAFLYPLSNKKVRGFIKTGSMSENLMFSAFVTGIIYTLIYIL